MKVEIDEEGFMVHCRQKDWSAAGINAAAYRENPPHGYKLIRSVVKRRKQTGTAVNMTLDFEWIDDRVTCFTPEEVYDEFQHLEPFKGPKLQGREQSPQGSASPAD